MSNVTSGEMRSVFGGLVKDYVTYHQKELVKKFYRVCKSLSEATEDKNFTIKAGDTVIYTNEFGISFRDVIVLGFANGKVHLADKSNPLASAFWFGVELKRIEKQEKRSFALASVRKTRAFFMPIMRVN